MQLHTGLSRSRWAAFGAAVAIGVGGGGVAVTNAVIGSGERAAFVPITPCRLFDMRPADVVGPRSTPLTAGETYTQQVTGSNGKCTIPSDATGVAMNVTAVGGTAGSFLTIWPADVDQPLASNLNWVPGAPPTPNKVDVKLSAAGQIRMFNLTGTVFVLADVVGYYADHNHDDRYYTKAQIDSLPSSSIAAGGVVTRDGFLQGAYATFGSTWNITKPGIGVYRINFPGLDPGCHLPDFPIVMLSVNDEPGWTAVYYSAGTNCINGDQFLEVRTADDTAASADVQFQFLAYRPGPGQVGPNPALARGGSSPTQCTLTIEKGVVCE